MDTPAQAFGVVGLLARAGGEGPGLARIVETLTFRAGFNTSVVLAGATLLGLAAGIVGVFAMLRKRSLMTDALSHATLPGITLAFLLASAFGVEGRSGPLLLVGAGVSGVLGVGAVQWLLRGTRLREDAAIGIVLSTFFGLGVVGLSYIQANEASGAAGLNRFLYGQTAAMRPGDAVLMGAIALIAAAGAALLIKEISLVCFDDQFARVDGWPVSAIDLAMMALVVLVTVAGLQAVGIVLVVALLIIPPVAARFWTERVRTVVVLSGVIGAVSGYLGAATSALLPRQPAGAVIVLTAGAAFVVSLLLAPSRGALASWIRLARLRLRIASDHALEASVVASRRTGATPTLVRTPAPLRFWLRRGGCVRGPGPTPVLSPRGVARGERVRRNHLLWSEYLISYADVAPSHVDWSVDQVEHILSDALVAELEAQLSDRGVNLSRARSQTARTDA